MEQRRACACKVASIILESLQNVYVAYILEFEQLSNPFTFNIMTCKLKSSSEVLMFCAFEKYMCVCLYACDRDFAFEIFYFKHSLSSNYVFGRAEFKECFGSKPTNQFFTQFEAICY